MGRPLGQPTGDASAPGFGSGRLASVGGRRLALVACGLSKLAYGLPLDPALDGAGLICPSEARPGPPTMSRLRSPSLATAGDHRHPQRQVQDRDTLPALNDGKVMWPSLRLALLDKVFKAERCQDLWHRTGTVGTACATESSKRSRIRRALLFRGDAGSLSALWPLQSLGWPAPQMRRPSRGRNQPPRLRCMPDGYRRSQQSRTDQALKQALRYI